MGSLLLGVVVDALIAKKLGSVARVLERCSLDVAGVLGSDRLRMGSERVDLRCARDLLERAVRELERARGVKGVQSVEYQADVHA